MTATPCTTRPACSTVDPELFFGPHDSAVAGAMFAWERRAVAVCTGCPVGAECLASALEFPADEQYGVIGAMTAAQRRALLHASGQRPTRTAIAQDAPTQAVALHEAAWDHGRSPGNSRSVNAESTAGSNVTEPGNSHSATVPSG
jgi:Transcription factor WhiB